MAGLARCSKSVTVLTKATKSLTVAFGCAPCKGGAFQWVKGPPGELLQPEAPGATLESGNEMVEAFGYVHWESTIPSELAKPFRVAKTAFRNWRP